ncbi:hypothetical protein Hanom_Chr00s000050g01617681 [Helianthus anomalus]
MELATVEQALTLGMAKIPEPDGYTRNPTQMGWVYPIPDGYWAGYGIRLKKFSGYGSGMGLGDSRPDYPKQYTHLPELYTHLPDFFFNLYVYFR